MFYILWFFGVLLASSLAALAGVWIESKENENK